MFGGQCRRSGRSASEGGLWHLGIHEAWTRHSRRDRQDEMNAEQLRALLQSVQAGTLSLDQAVERLEQLPFADLGFARVDHHRALRQRVPEVVFAPGKTDEQLVSITRELAGKGQTALITRITESSFAHVGAAFPELTYNPVARTALLQGTDPPRRRGEVFVVTAGTSDLPVAEEARETLHACGVPARMLADVGVAGLHRLLSDLDTLRGADVLIVVAGMEGALASVVGGLVKTPVIAVPTSVGYGAAFQGLAALLGMLTSCAAGVVCVNIDNGFGAAMAAVRILDTFASQDVE